MDRKAIFDYIRTGLMHNKIAQSQVDGINVILDEWDMRVALATAGKDPVPPTSWLAYMLATAYHETAHTFQPIEEFGKGKGKKYGAPVNGHVYYGRGLVQLTWDYNYKTMGELLNIDLLNHPELALDAKNAVQIMFEGMERGTFTGKKLSTYLNNTKTDYVNARRIINGTDRASLIAGYADAFHEAILAAQG